MFASLPDSLKIDVHSSPFTPVLPPFLGRAWWSARTLAGRLAGSGPSSRQGQVRSDYTWVRLGESELVTRHSPTGGQTRGTYRQKVAG